MSQVTVYGLKRCSTCIKACQWLAVHGVTYQFIDYRAQPVQAASLVAWAGKLGGWEKLVNRASLTWRNLPAARRQIETDAAWTALIADYPTLVRRPLIITPNGEVMVGFSEKLYGERFT